MSSLTQNKFLRNTFAEQAYQNGISDGAAGIKGGWEYAGGAGEYAYSLGHLVGIARAPRRLAGGSPVNRPKSEVELMDADLAALRSGRMQPIIRYTDKMMIEIENERF